MDGLHFREATGDDATFYADVFTALRPTRPTDPVVERYWWEQPDDTYVSRRWVVQQGGRDIGVATFDHPAWARLQVPHGDIGGDLAPDRRDRSTLDALLAEMERRLVAEGAKRVAVRANEDDELRIATILGRGFHEDRRHRRWLLVTFALGISFLVSQLLAWRELARQGVYVASNPHSSFFYLFTAAHGVHLLGGLAALVYLLLRTRAPQENQLAIAKSLDGADAVTLYWHFMDFLWLYLFVLLFFVR